MKLFKHQEKILEMAKTRNALGLWWEMGTGKTLATLELMIRYGGNAVVVCPKIVIDTWVKEIQARNLRGFRKLGKSVHSVYFIADTNLKRRMDFFKMLTTDDEGRTMWPTYLIINYEAVRNRKLFYALFDAFEKNLVTTLVADESHRIKNIKSQQSKAMIALSRVAKYKLALTGTPVTNSAIDVFSQALFLDGGKTFGESEFAFKHKYCTATYFVRNRPVAWKTNPKYLDELNQKFSSLGLRVKKEEVLDLPERVVKNIYVELSPEQAKVYQDLKTQAISVFSENEFIACPNVLTELIRLQQCVSGHIPKQTMSKEGVSKTQEIHIFKKTPRIEALVELLKDLEGQKTIVWTCFKEDIKQIGDAMHDAKIAYTFADGSLNQKRRMGNIETFKLEPKVNVLLANRQACAEGINLTEASYSITYSRGFSLTQEKQAEARNYRKGSERHKKITHINLIAKNTVDEQIIKALNSKQDIAKAVLEELKNEQSRT